MMQGRTCLLLRLLFIANFDRSFLHIHQLLAANGRVMARFFVCRESQSIHLISDLKFYPKS